MKILLFLLCLFAGSAFGQLTWDTTEQTFQFETAGQGSRREVQVYQYRPETDQDSECANLVWLHDRRIDQDRLCPG